MHLHTSGPDHRRTTDTASPPRGRSAAPFAVSLLALLALVALGPRATLALDLGEARVESRLGEPFAATIPLHSVAGPVGIPDLAVEIPGYWSQLDLGLAQPVLTPGLHATVVEGADGVPAIRLSSSESVHETVLHFLLRARHGETRALREYALVVDPPAHATVASTAAVAPSMPAGPAPATAPPSWSAPPRTSAPTWAPEAAPAAGSYGPVRPGETLAAILRARLPDLGIGLDAAARAVVERNPSAFIGGDPDRLLAGAVLRVPSVGGASAVVESTPIPLAPSPLSGGSLTVLTSELAARLAQVRQTLSDDRARREGLAARLEITERRIATLQRQQSLGLETTPSVRAESPATPPVTLPSPLSSAATGAQDPVAQVSAPTPVAAAPAPTASVALTPAEVPEPPSTAAGSGSPVELERPAAGSGSSLELASPGPGSGSLVELESLATVTGPRAEESPAIVPFTPSVVALASDGEPAAATPAPAGPPTRVVVTSPAPRSEGVVPLPLRPDELRSFGRWLASEELRRPLLAGALGLLLLAALLVLGRRRRNLTTALAGRHSPGSEAAARERLARLRAEHRGQYAANDDDAPTNDDKVISFSALQAGRLARDAAVHLEEDPAAAEAELREAVRLEPHHPQHRQLLAALLRGTGRHAEALEVEDPPPPHSGRDAHRQRPGSAEDPAHPLSAAKDRFTRSEQS